MLHRKSSGLQSQLIPHPVHLIKLVIIDEGKALPAHAMKAYSSNH